MTLQLIRAFLLLIFLAGTLGSAGELLLLGHTEETLQWVPLILFGAAILVLSWYALAYSRSAMRFFRATTSLFILSGLLGILFHYRGNVEFELEMYPDLHGFSLFWNSITGPIPALAPGTMIVLGLLGWVYTFRHPVLLNKRSITADITSVANTER